MFAGLTSLIRDLFSKFSYAFDTTNSQFKPYFDYGYPFSNNDFDQSLKLLTQVLHKYHNKQVIVLIDEYDTPLQTAYVYGFYEQIATRLRMMFGAALKDNLALYKAVLTGITRIAQANLFSGLNHYLNSSLMNRKAIKHGKISLWK